MSLLAVTKLLKSQTRILGPLGVGHLAEHAEPGRRAAGDDRGLAQEFRREIRPASSCSASWRSRRSMRLLLWSCLVVAECYLSCDGSARNCRQLAPLRRRRFHSDDRDRRARPTDRSGPRRGRAGHAQRSADERERMGVTVEHRDDGHAFLLGGHERFEIGPRLAQPAVEQIRARHDEDIGEHAARRAARARRRRPPAPSRPRRRCGPHCPRDPSPARRARRSAGSRRGAPPRADRATAAAPALDPTGLVDSRRYRLSPCSRSRSRASPSRRIHSTSWAKAGSK